VKNLTVGKLLSYLRGELSSPYSDPGNLQLGRSLDSFIEARVHGNVALGMDVERLVADPAFRETKTERTPKGHLLQAQHLTLLASGFQAPRERSPG
jgi:hypothetical protein